MTLTPSDIEQKTFSTALRGYNLDEVDDFLDEVVRSMRKLQEDLDSARSDLEKAQAEPVAVSPPLPVVEAVTAPEPAPSPVAPPPPPIDESAVGKALIAAQETADRIVSDARSEADRILVDARSEVDSFEQTRMQRKAEAEQEIAMIDGLVDRVKEELVGLSAAVGGDLEAMTSALDQARSELGSSTGLAGDDDEQDDDPGTVDGEDGGDLENASAGGDLEDDDEEEDDDDEDEGHEEYFDFPDGDDDEEDDGAAT